MLFAAFPINCAPGAVSISVADGTIQAGGQLMVEIGIDSDNSTDNLSEYLLILRITALDASGDSSLEFVDPQSEAV